MNARLENGCPEYPANTNCDAAKAIPPGNRIRRALKLSWMSFHSSSAALKAPVTGTTPVIRLIWLNETRWPPVSP